jgi:hypothetical protein
MIQFLQFLLSVEMLWVEASDLLTLEGSDNGVVVGEVVAGRSWKDEDPRGGGRRL